MTTILLVPAFVLLAVACGVAGWTLHRRRDRVAMAVAVAPTLAPAATGSDEPVDHGQATSNRREVMARLYAAAFEGGLDDDGLANPGDARHAQVSRAASALLSGLKPGPRYAPRRPRLLPLLLSAVKDEDSSGREIAAIIARDPALAGNLLRIANSALYRVQPTPIENIERAVVLIGTDGLRQMLAVALMQPVMSGGRGAFARLPPIIWEHTVLSAAAAVEHARRVERIDAFTAQMLGLVHGLGAIVVVQVVRDSYARHPKLAPESDVVTRTLERWAAPTAQRLARDWALSPGVQSALEDQRRDLPLCELSPLGRALHIGLVAGAEAMQKGEKGDGGD